MSDYRPRGSAFRGSQSADYMRELDALRRLAHLLDETFRIPVIGYRIGLEPILGLIPVIGDAGGFLISGYLIVRAARLGLPKSLISRMILNAVIDTVIGSIPIVGDMFDFFWKVNKRNVRLLERHLLAHA